MASAESLQRLPNRTIFEATIDNNECKSGSEDGPHDERVESGVTLHVVNGIKVDAVEFIACAWPSHQQ